MAAVAIEESMKVASPSAALAFYYCDYKSPERRETVNVLASLAGQLARQNDLCFEMITHCFKATLDGLPPHTLPDSLELSQLILRMSACFDSVAIIVDALDECHAPYEITEALAGFSDS